MQIASGENLLSRIQELESRLAESEQLIQAIVRSNLNLPIRFSTRDSICSSMVIDRNKNMCVYAQYFALFLAL